MSLLIAHAEIISYKGKIQGSCDMKGREGTIEAYDIASSIRIKDGVTLKELRDFFFGYPRNHGVFTLCKKLDQSTPLLLQALATVEPIFQVIIRIYRINPFAHEEHYYTITLENALVKGLSQEYDQEYVSFAYEKITWRHEIDGKEAEDTWQMMSTEKGLPVFTGRPATKEPQVTNVSGKTEKTKESPTQKAPEPPEPTKLEEPQSPNEKNAELNKNDNNKVICLEEGHPVNSITGAVVEAVTDFVVPGRIPLVWERHYSSQSLESGYLGQGWQCPADARLVFDHDGMAVFHHGSKSASVFDHVPLKNDTVPDVKNDLFLHQTDSHFTITDKNNINRHFLKADGKKVLYLERITDSKGNALIFRRDVNGLAQIEDSAGQKIKVFTENGHIRLMVRIMPDNSETKLVSYEYDHETGDLVTACDVKNAPLSYEYVNHCLTRLTLRSGQTFNYGYDKHTPDGTCQRTWGDDGLYDYHFDYNKPARQTRITDSLGYSKILDYDGHYQPIQTTDHQGHVTRYEYNDQDKPTAIIDPLGRITTYRYDKLGNLTGVLRPDGTTIGMTYDANCNPVTITDPNGNVWHQHFEDRALLTGRISPLGAETRYAYNNKGDLVSVTAPNGGNTQFFYDDMGNITAITHADGSTERFDRDPFGNIISAYDPLDRKTDYVYDDAFRLTRIIKPSGGVIACEYDTDDRLIRHTDEAGNTTKLTYTGMGRIKKRINPDGTEINYHYDTEERLKTLTNERGEIYEFKRDHTGRITHEIDYWGNERSYLYDPAGQLLQSIDPLHRITEFKTDALGRLIEKTFSDPDTAHSDRNRETFTYDSNGNLIAHENDQTRVERIYDAENRLTQEIQGDHSTVHEYDTLGNRTRRLSALGNDIRYDYDILGRTVGITINGAAMAITRNALGLPTKEIFANGLERTYDYTADNQLADQVVILPQGNTIKRAYEYDPVGNLTARIDADKGSRYFTYNPMGRITQYTDPEQKIKEFLHDPAGDLFKRSDKEETDGSRHVNHDGTNYHFDAAGNLIERSGKRGNHTFDWDENNRLISATNTETGAQTSMTYDAQGRRLSKTTNDQTTTFTWDGDQLLSDNVGGNNEREFVYYPGSFEPLAIIDPNKTIHLIHTDSVGLPHEVTDDNGNIVWSACYDAIGNIEKLDINDFDNPLRFQGQYFDSEIDLSYNRYRYFDSKTGSFISQDPLGLTAGNNVYDYAPNVWCWIDPLGLSCEQEAPINGVGLTDPNTLELSHPANLNTPFSNPQHGTVGDLAEGLKKGDIQAIDIPPVEVVKIKGKIYSANNRRLRAFQEAGVDIQTVPASKEQVRKIKQRLQKRR